MIAVVAACLALAAVVVAWPAAGRRTRLRRVLGVGMTPAPQGTGSGSAEPARPQVAHAPRQAGPRVGGHGSARPAQPRLPRRPHWVPPALLVAAGAVLAAVLGGPVAGAVVSAYGMFAARLAIRRWAEQDRTRRRVELLDLLSAAAADLRAGLPPDTALASLHSGHGRDPLRARPTPRGDAARRQAPGVATAGSAERTAGWMADDPAGSQVDAAVRLAERTGAPLADVIERIEADARSTDRARAASSAQAAGARATAWLLAGLPAGGIGLGYAIGTDPLEVLLHTPIGAACMVGAVMLQLGGLAWAGRITRTGSIGISTTGSVVAP